MGDRGAADTGQARRAKLTKRAVDGIEPGLKPFVVWDTDLSGFGVKVLASGKKRYVFRYRVGGGRGGQSREPVIGSHGSLTPDEARAIAKRWAAEVAQGGDPGGDRTARRAAPTMAELFDRYMREHAEKKKKPRSAADDRMMIEKKLKPAFGAMKVADVRRADIAAWAEKQTAKVRANRALALLSKAFNLAIVWEMRPCETNPVKLVPRNPEHSRKRYLTRDEWSRLGKAFDMADRGELALESGGRIDPLQVAAIRVLALTGARKSEVLTLQWAWLRPEAGRAELPDSKTGAKPLYIPPPAFEILRGIQRQPGSPYVFPCWKTGEPLLDVRHAWDSIRAAAGLKDVRIHDLRHSFASVGASSGLSLLAIGALLGHRSPTTTARYAHLLDEAQVRNAAMIAGRVAAVWNGAPEPDGGGHDEGGGAIIPLRSIRRRA